MKRLPVVMLGVLWLAGAPAVLEAQGNCPNGFAAGTTCYAGVDEHGAHFLIAVPKDYTNQLVLWNHGYTLAPPAPLGAADLGPGLLLLSQGYAVAASSYRPDALGLGGWAVADGAEDTERLRLGFTQLVGQPDLTFVIGASEGGLITAAIIERFGANDDGTLNYQGALPLCGPLAGGRRNLYGGFDLRVVYQYYCQNLPRPDETPYPLFLGLAPDNTITPEEEAARVNECTGVLLPPDRRTPQQLENLANILNVVHIPESFLLTDMGLATFALQELVLVRTQGRNPVTNLGVTYTGSTDDEALNAGVFRAGSDPDAVAWLVAAYDPTGAVSMPTFAVHTIGDGEVIVENERAYRQTLRAAGNGSNLFQMYTNANGHCEFSQSEVMASFAGLRAWVDTGTRPTQDEIVDLCEQFRGELGDTCNFNTTFTPRRFESRVRPREP
jgi:hypothetical protein